MVLLERDNELSTLEDLFSECLQGKGRVAIVSGPVSSGKTALLHAFAQRVIRSDATLLTAMASRAECTLPLGVVSELFRGVELTPQSAERVKRLLNDGMLTATLQEGKPDPEATATLTAPVLDGLCAELVRLAERRPLLIGIDDVHYADDASLHFLLYLARRLETVRILVVLNRRAQLRTAHAPFYAELSHLPQCRLIQIGPLSRTGVAGMLAEHLDARTAPFLASAYHSVSGGNPLLVQALCEDFRASARRTAADLLAGDAFKQAVLNCLYRCEPALLALSGAVAVLDEAASPHTLGKLVDLDTASVTQALNALNAIGILGSHRFRHPHARAAVLGHLTPGERQALHARAGRLLHDDGAAATVVARHLIAAEKMDALWTVPVLCEAAEYALLDNDLNLAVSALRLAYQVCADDRGRATIAAALARAEWRYDPAIAARRLPELLSAVRSGILTGWDAITTIGHLIWEGQAKEAVEALGRLGGGTAAAPDTDPAACLDITRLWLSLAYPGRFERALGNGVLTAPGDDSATADPQLAAAYRLVSVLKGETQDDDVAGAERMLERSRLGSTSLGSIIAALATLICTGNLVRAAYWCDLLRDEAATLRAPTWRAVLTAAHATISLRRGDLPTAESSARTALALIPPKSWGVAVGEPLASLVLAAVGRGRYEVAATYLGPPVPDAMFQTVFAIPYLRARGWYQLATDRCQAGLADFRACGDAMIRWGIDLPTLAPWRTDLAQAYLALGETDRAAELVEEQLTLLKPTDFRTRGISLRVRAMVSDPGERVALLEATVHEQQICGDKYELALALAALSRAQRSVGEYDRVYDAAHRAYELAHECEAEPLRNRLLSENIGDGLGGPDRGAVCVHPIDELSSAERRVAALAAQGHTNREIAGKLYITVSTVEQHLTRVYRKLNVNRRTDLPRSLQHVTLD
jgi:DNA-binding CsgD family transcriptional regulator